MNSVAIKYINNCMQMMQLPLSINSSSLTIDQIVYIVSWLENRKIRQLDINERNYLNSYTLEWDKAFDSYLNALNSPFEWGKDSYSDCLVWLFNYALNLEYEENASDIRDIENFQSKIDNSLVRRSNEYALKLGGILNLAPKVNESIIEFVRRLDTVTKFNYLSEDKNNHAIEEFEPDDFELGFKVEDQSLRKSLIVLKMMYISDLRSLQSDMNRLITSGQEFTANPKTNTALGKVGK